jgi:hypothetical protein
MAAVVLVSGCGGHSRCGGRLSLWMIDPVVKVKGLSGVGGRGH